METIEGMTTEKSMYLQYIKKTKFLGITLFKKELFQGPIEPHRNYLEKYYLLGIKYKTVKRIRK